jgi:SAM-dependent methyltransferase
VRRAANAWDRFYRHQVAPWRGERPVEDLLGWLGDGPVLELGVGNGKALRPLRRAGVEVVPLDIAWHPLRRLGDGVLADAARLPLRDASFSAVLDLHCSGHLPPAGRGMAAREAARVVRPGGHVVVVRLGPEDVRARQGRPVEGDPAARILADGRVTAFETLDEIAARLRTAALSVVEKEAVTRRKTWRGTPVVRQELRVVARSSSTAD